MIIIGIEFFCLCAIAVLANWIVKRIMTKRISKTEKAKESVRLRKKYRILRLIIKILFCVFFVIEFVLVIANGFDYRLPAILIYFILSSFLLLGLYVLSFMALPVSGITIEDVKEDSFDLYLRGFSSDDYYDNRIAEYVSIANRQSLFSNKDYNVESEYIKMELADEWGVKNKIEIEKTFSERLFYRAYRKAGGRKMYCVGMTKELESPEGSDRIYLNDETWKDDVRSLIDRAKHVFILVNPSDSCVWEILECVRIAEGKTIFFIHYPEFVREISEKSREKAPAFFKKLLDNDDDALKHTMVYVEDGETKVLRYLNTKKGFEEMFSKNILFKSRE